MKKALALILVFSMLFCTACGGQQGTPTEPSDPTTAPTVGNVEYTVSVVDDFGNPIGEGVIVNFCKGGQTVAMQAADASGIAKKTLAADTYTVTLSFTDPNATYTYTDGVVTAENPAATITLSGVMDGQTIFAGGKDHFAYLLTVGTKTVQVNANQRTYFLFRPDQGGLYEFSVSDNAVLGYYGAPHFVQDQNVAEMKDGMFTISVPNSSLGAVYVLGVDTDKTSVNVTIERIGDAEKTIADYEWTVYQPTAELKPYTLPSNVTLKDFDLTAKTKTYKLVYSEKDGYYHLGSAKGEIVYMKLGVASAYLDSIVDVIDVSGVSCYFFDDDGNFLKKESYNECLMQYVENMDTQSGVYPLTQDLYYIIQQRGQYVGWWDKDSATYLFIDKNGNPVVGINEEIAWLFLCCYGEVTAETPAEPAPTEPKPTEPAPTAPKPTEPAPTEPKPTEPAPTEPKPTEPAPTAPKPTEPAPTEPKPTEPAPTEPTKPAEPEFEMGTQEGEVTELQYYEIAGAMAFQAQVPAGTYVAYDFYKMYNMVLTIESKYCYLVFNGEVYLPENGVLTFPLVYGRNDVSSPCSVYIGNFGYEDDIYSVNFTVIPGTQNAPEELKLGTTTVTTREGDDQGYYFRYNADMDGYLVVTFEDINIDFDCQISVYNHNTYVYSVDINSEVFVEVFEGDEVEVVIAVLDDNQKYPSAEVTFTVVLEE